MPISLFVFYEMYAFLLCFQLLYARGDLVELLITSNIARYAEFRAVDRILTCIDNEMKVVPCSRADVFTNKNVTVLEKRLLMKILTNCMNNNDNDNENEFKGEFRFDQILLRETNAIQCDFRFFRQNIPSLFGT